MARSKYRGQLDGFAGVADTLRMAKNQELTVREQNFAMAFVGEANGDAMAAYRLAYSVANSKATTISTAASKVLGRPHVQAYIASLRAKITDRFEIGAADVLRKMWEIATADPRELIQAERRCCRHCHGVGFAYQWKDGNEWAIACAKELSASEIEKRPPLIPSNAGGFGFDHSLAPIDDCTECRGDGHLEVMIADTRKLSEAGAALYAGVKTTRDGVEVKMRDRDMMLTNVAKALGVFGDADSKGKPAASFNFNFSGKVSASEATKLYRELML